MKKTLAILLALLAAASITLTSCQNDGREPVNDDNWDDQDNEYVDTDNSNEDTSKDTTNDNTDGDNENNNNNNNNNTNPSGWEAKNDTVYAGVLLVLRGTPSASGENLAEIPYGTALARAESNGTWDKVTYGDKTGYVMHVYVSANNSAFNYTNVESPVSISVKTDSDKNVVFYTTPFVIDNESYAANWLCNSGIKAEFLSEGYTLKKLAVSENKKWVKVEFVGTVTINAKNSATYPATNPGIVYIQATSFDDGRIVDSTWSSGSGGGNSGALG